MTILLVRQCAQVVTILFQAHIEDHYRANVGCEVLGDRRQSIFKRWRESTGGQGHSIVIAHDGVENFLESGEIRGKDGSTKRRLSPAIEHLTGITGFRITTGGTEDIGQERTERDADFFTKRSVFGLDTGLKKRIGFYIV